MAHNSVTVRVPAKVNLQLSVGPRESDGFHNLVSVFQSISIFDDVTVTKSNPGSGVTISVTGEHTHGVPEDHSNFAVKAAQLVGEKFDFAVDVHIEIKKSIPVKNWEGNPSFEKADKKFNSPKTIEVHPSIKKLVIKKRDMVLQ